MNYFVTAIGTDSGKTVASAILCQALRADYWKPVQAGFPKDSEIINGLIDAELSTVHPERYVLKTPASPHAAAALEKIHIKIEDFIIPKHKKDLVIEGAGGCLVPLNDHDFVIDLVSHFNAQVILVSNLYLGSINHTLLSYEALKHRNLKVKGIIFNGERNIESEQIILHHTMLPCLLHIEQEATVDKEMVQKYAKHLMIKWNE